MTDAHVNDWRTSWACLGCGTPVEQGQPRCHRCGHEASVRIVIPALDPSGKRKATA